MAIEIERKFLVKSTAFKQISHDSYIITQGFLNSHKDRTVRVRLKGGKGYLTVKGKSSENGLSRFEWEQELSETDAKALLALCEDGIIEKKRYETKIGDHVFEIDEFRGDNTGLIIAEVELHSENEAFISPNWLGEEVTGDVRYYNSQLSKRPYTRW